nr:MULTISPECIES: class I SAM-dependent methyltransferase [unclassified Exiguobacterium]
MNIANICGSNGRKAVPLSILGAEVTIFDLSEENKRYALELADCSNTAIKYVVGDILDLDMKKYQHHFDLLYLEGGILHYFDDLAQLMDVLYSILKVGRTHLK